MLKKWRVLKKDGVMNFDEELSPCNHFVNSSLTILMFDDNSTSYKHIPDSLSRFDDIAFLEALVPVPCNTPFTLHKQYKEEREMVINITT